MSNKITVGVLALQGAFVEHIKLLRLASNRVVLDDGKAWSIIEVRTSQQLEECDALIIPGGESTTISLVAARTGLLEPLRDFVKGQRKPTWGTCAGLILLAESANRTKKGGQDLIGGLDVRVNRNYFGRQIESFQADLALPFLENGAESVCPPFDGVFIRAPVVEKLLPVVQGEQKTEARRDDTVVAPSKEGSEDLQPVRIMATLPGRSRLLKEKIAVEDLEEEIGDIVAVKQGNVFGTSFHPELTDDVRIHEWWLREVRDSVDR